MPPQTTDPAHAFDFWVGEWDVFGPQGRQVGTNSITALFGTGMLAEHWHGNGGVEGRSLNAWDEVAVLLAPDLDGLDWRRACCSTAGQPAGRW